MNRRRVYGSAPDRLPSSWRLGSPCLTEDEQTAVDLLNQFPGSQRLGDVLDLFEVAVEPGSIAGGRLWAITLACVLAHYQWVTFPGDGSVIVPDRWPTIRPRQGSS